MMTDITLTAAQSAYLALLMAEAREVSNTELKEKYGISITGKDSDALVDQKLATVKEGPKKARIHELTDLGWAEAKKAMAGPYVKAQGAAPANAALHAVLAAVHRYFDRVDVSAADFFAPSEAPIAEPSAKTTKEARPKSDGKSPVNVPLRITNAYGRLKKKYGNDWVILTELRREIKGVSFELVDEALLEMVTKGKIRLIPEENQRTLTAADRSAAIFVGGEEKHLIGIGVA